MISIPIAAWLAVASPASPSPAEVEQLIQAFGPVMHLQHTERYRMDDPDYILSSGKTALAWGLAHHDQSYDSFRLDTAGKAKLAGDADLLAATTRAARDPRASSPDFRCWLQIDDSLLAGNQSRAKAIVSVIEAPDRSYLDLQFWFFYPFNGPGKFRVTFGKAFTDHVAMNTCGRHYGDWEHVTLRLVRTAAPSGLPWRLVDVYLSRHSISRWLGGVSSLRFSDRHPIIYIARDSHAHYESSGTHYYRRGWSKDYWFGKVTVDLEDWTDDGPVFDTSQPGHYRIMASNIPGWILAQPAWYSCRFAWGQYEKLMFSYRHLYTYKEVGSAPAGPAFHGPD